MENFNPLYINFRLLCSPFNLIFKPLKFIFKEGKQRCISLEDGHISFFNKIYPAYLKIYPTNFHLSYVVRSS